MGFSLLIKKIHSCLLWPARQHLKTQMLTSEKCTNCFTSQTFQVKDKWTLWVLPQFCTEKKQISRKLKCFGTTRPAQHDSIVSVPDSVNKNCDKKTIYLQHILPHRSMFVRMKTSECRKLRNVKSKRLLFNSPIQDHNC